MEQWQHYGAQYLSQNQAPVQAQPQPQQGLYQSYQETYQQPAVQQQPVVQPQPVVQAQPVPQQMPSELSLDTLPRTSVQEPPPTPASQALADLLDDLDF